MRDVAALAQVSAMTVSRVLHDDPRVTALTKQRVLAAVDELGYRRDETARNLRLGRGTGLIGLVVTNLANPFYSQLALGVGEVADELGINVVLANSAEDPAREARLVDDLISRRVDGIIVVPAGDDHRHLDPVKLHQVPVVLAARPPSGVEADCVLVDDFGGTREAVRLLIARGHTKIAFLGLPPSAYTGAERYSGFRAAMTEAGLPVDDAYVHYQTRDITAAEQAATNLLALPDPPTALFAANNRNTIGAIRAINNTGAGTELVGFDDFELADMLGLPLTVVAYDPGEVGQHAANLLIDRLRGKGDAAPAQRIVLPTKVVEYLGHPKRQ
ncbi:LacI family DNA-binding transcriptional regulator [Streptomyces sp. NPDC049040]|uniref:LacI family DNA-binding transcriptional regulator n=1 Tax=Streptomyces sp. NPDC049040 TaxID=3365593 RepID=UPI0037190B76